jgi:hypothetical protein
VPAPTPRAVRVAVPLGPDIEVGLPHGEPGAAFRAASGSYTSTTAFPALYTCATRHAPASRAARLPPPVVRHWLATACTSLPYLTHGGETREPPYSPTFKYVASHPPRA